MHFIYKILSFTWLGLPTARAKSCPAASLGSQGHFWVGIIEMCIVSTFQRRFRGRWEVYCYFLVRKPEKVMVVYWMKRVLAPVRGSPGWFPPVTGCVWHPKWIIVTHWSWFHSRFGMLSEVTCPKSNTVLVGQWWESGILISVFLKSLVHWLHKDLTEMS